MKFLKIEEAIETQTRWVSPKASLDEAFPNLRLSNVQSSGYTWPMHAARNAINLLWLQWHQGISFEEIKKTIEFIIKRGIQANNDPQAHQSLREEHDNFLIQLAVITGVKKWMLDVCESVIEANPKLDEYQYLQAWTGILKYKILGEDNRVVEQYELMKKWKPDRIFLWPLDKLVESFVEKDYKTFNMALKRSCERQWKWSEKEKAITKDSDGEIVLDVYKRHDHFLWPWVECAFAKLAYLDGAEIKYDSPWLPLELVKAIEK